MKLYIFLIELFQLSDLDLLGGDVGESGGGGSGDYEEALSGKKEVPCCISHLKGMDCLHIFLFIPNFFLGGGWSRVFVCSILLGSIVWKTI